MVGITGKSGKMKVLIEITSCNDCPYKKEFRDEYNFDVVCQHGDIVWDDVLEHHNGLVKEVPMWCPLDVSNKPETY